LSFVGYWIEDERISFIPERNSIIIKECPLCFNRFQLHTENQQNFKIVTGNYRQHFHLCVKGSEPELRLNITP
jgi:hypothetical protein